MRIVAVALFAPLWWGGIILYVVLPSRIGFLSIPLPNWFRLIMVCVAALGMSFALWAFRTLGRNWVHALEAPQFVRRKDNVLVTNGPYHYVRNPIYLGAFTFILAVTLVAANWLLVLPALALVTIIYMQIGKEEKMLIDRFGDEYREYMKRTPRFIPKLGSRR
jgi:protein-S-isoprenylcysteine O-methyltransferase Ste14